MTLRETTTVGEYNDFCYKELVADLGLRDEFEEVTGEPLSEYEFNPSETSEENIIRKVLDAAQNKFILNATVVGHNEEMLYSVMRLDE